MSKERAGIERAAGGVLGRCLGLCRSAAALSTPTLILQGERDSFGKRDEVEGYALSPQLQLGWIPSGDHSFKPTRSSGLSEPQNWATAVARWSSSQSAARRCPPG